MNSKKRSRVNEYPNYDIYDTGRICNKKGHEMIQTINSNGYSMVCLSNKGKSRLCSVHRLVAKAFIPNPENKPEVNHKDGNKQNNRVDNLEWATDREQMIHAYSTGLRKNTLTKEIQTSGGYATRDKHGRPVRVIETDEIFPNIHECARQLNCDLGAISKCCNGKAKRHHGYSFEFIEREDRDEF